MLSASLNKTFLSLSHYRVDLYQHPTTCNCKYNVVTASLNKTWGGGGGGGGGSPTPRSLVRRCFRRQWQARRNRVVVGDGPTGNQKKKGGARERDALNTFLSTVIWRRTYGKGPFR